MGAINVVYFHVDNTHPVLYLKDLLFFGNPVSESAFARARIIGFFTKPSNDIERKM